jgi:D-serine deaminase-like pyridoxal phosphate-dependent protein
VSEIEFLQPVLREFLDAGRQVSMLYGMPLPPSQVDRLAINARQLGPGIISVLVDHPSQLHHLNRFFKEAGFAAGVYLKVDTGYHRAGLPPSGINKDGLVASLMNLENQGMIDFIGLYSHSSLSYHDSTPKQAMANLEAEINGCLEALDRNTGLFPNHKTITISVGASPQVTAVENLVGPENTLSEDAIHLRQTLQKAMTKNPNGLCTKLELHAGVYCVLDIQQLSTHSRAHFGDYEEEIAISVVAEVCSVYNDNERQQPEALLAVGVSGLGREPCVAYEGWGIIDRKVYSTDNVKPEGRLIVSRVSQEQCIVSWGQTKGHEEQKQLPPIPLEVGQTVRIYPNHACITGTMHDWYFVVDSSEHEERVVDIWERASRW